MSSTAAGGPRNPTSISTEVLNTAYVTAEDLDRR